MSAIESEDDIFAELDKDAQQEDRNRRIAEWRRENTNLFGYKTQRVAVEEKDAQPVEFIRKIVKDNGDLSGKRFKTERKLCVAMLQYAPLALFKLLENMPMPWEEVRYVDVLYHIGGVLTIVDDTPKVAEPLYLSQWGSVWTHMRTEKVEIAEEGGSFERVIHKGDENEPPLDYGDYLMDRDPPPALKDHLDSEENAAIADWFYDPFPRLVSPNQIQGSRRPNGYYFSVEVMEALYRQAAPILSVLTDKNYFYLWDLPSFYAAKAMHVAIPRAPKFEPPPALAKREEEEDDWTEFNDVRRIIYRDDPRKPRFAMLTERQIAFPFLYSNTIESVPLIPYHYPASSRVENDDPDLPCFTFHPSLNAIRAVKKEFDDQDIPNGELCSPAVRRARRYPEELELPADFEPFLSDLPLETEDTKVGLSLMFAPEPFNSLRVE